MKVIGHIPDRDTKSSRLLVEMTRSEWANLCGTANSGLPMVGAIMRVNLMYKRLTELNGNQERLQKVGEELRDIARTLEQLEPVISSMAAVPQRDPSEEEWEEEAAG